MPSWLWYQPSMEVEEIEAAPRQRIAIAYDQLLAHCPDLVPRLGRAGGIETDLLEGFGIDGEGGDIELAGEPIDLAVDCRALEGARNIGSVQLIHRAEAERLCIHFLDQPAGNVGRPHLVVVHVDHVGAGPCPHRGEHLLAEVHVGDDFVLDLDVRVSRHEFGDRGFVLIDHRRVRMRPELDLHFVLSSDRRDTPSRGP